MLRDVGGTVGRPRAQRWPEAVVRKKPVDRQTLSPTIDRADDSILLAAAALAVVDEVKGMVAGIGCAVDGCEADLEDLDGA